MGKKQYNTPVTVAVASSFLFSYLTDSYLTHIPYAVTGAYTATEWRNQGDNYYGSGESFLFSYKRTSSSTTNSSSSSSSNDDTELDIDAYKWTYRNSLYQLSNNTQLAIGGGEGFGILLTNDFRYVESMPCDTYGNTSFHVYLWGHVSMGTAGALAHHAWTAPITITSDIVIIAITVW